MQYIKKQNTEPSDWNTWFTVPPNRRTYDYGKDSSSLPQLRSAKQYLIDEQNSLCAYCQQKIDINDSSIEHVTPKEHNKELSTSYFNLVAVCHKNQVKDHSTGRFHCDRDRGSKLISPIIFYSESQSASHRLNPFFRAYSNGEIIAKEDLPISIKNQVEAFIDTLNLNHYELKENRAKGVIRGLTDAYSSSTTSHKKIFWKAQYDRVLNNHNHPFREFLLVYIGPKIGLN